METTLNRLQVKALLLDTITHLKTGHHLYPQYKSARSAFIRAKGMKTNISSFKLLCAIGQVYKENDLLSDFVSTCERMHYPINVEA